MTAPTPAYDPAAAAALAEAAAAPEDVKAPETSPATRPRIVSYWGYEENFNVVLPGQESLPAEWQQYIVCRKMNEGSRQKYQKKTNQKVTILKESNNAEMGVDPARDRMELIKASVVDWKIYREDPAGEPYLVPFSDKTFLAWFDQADPVAIEALERKIRDKNPWMQANMTVEAVEEEIERLTEVRDELKQKEADAETFH